ncbi:MAG: hypothetical protein R2734_10810 [Nocardioides sp.]
MAIWEDQGRILVARRPPGGSWGARVVLDASGKARSPQVETFGKARFLAAWAVVDHPNAGNGPTRVKVRASRGAGWDPAVVVVSRVRGQFRDLDLAVAPSGAAVLGWEWLWHDWGGRLLVTHRRGPAAAWVTPRRWDGMWEFDALIGGSGLRAVAMHRQAGGRHRIQVIRGGLGRP